MISLRVQSGGVDIEKADWTRPTPLLQRHIMIFNDFKTLENEEKYDKENFSVHFSGLYRGKDIWI